MSRTRRVLARPVAHLPLKALGLALLVVALLGGMLTACRDEHREGIVALSMSSMRFDDPVLRVPAGQPITLSLRNDDGYAHSFDLDEFDLHVPLAGKERVDVLFTPERPGTFTYYCGAAGHRSAGMTGTLIVEP